MKTRFKTSQAVIEKGRPRKYLRIMLDGQTRSIADLAETDGATYTQAKKATWKLGTLKFVKSNPKASKYDSALYYISEAGVQEIEEADKLLFEQSIQIVGETMVNRTIREQPSSVWALGARAC